MTDTKRSTTKVELSVDETIALLRKTQLPTILVEGVDDMIVYRKFEKRLSHLNVSVLPVGNRLSVLNIFSRRSEIAADIKIAFIADRDTWIYSEIPPSYRNPHLIFTDGYSIENDVFSDGNFIDLLNGEEKTDFLRELDLFVRWYSLAVRRHLNDPAQAISHHPNRVLDNNQFLSLTTLKSDEQYPESFRSQILADYQRLLRGKSLISLLVRHTSYNGRQPHHSSTALLEMVAVHPGPLLTQITNQLKVALGIQTENEP